MAREIRIGTSGWLYPPWRGTFYPKGLPHRLELAYLAQRVGTVEINGSFYSLQRPERYARWFEQTPDDFLFSVKGGRFITHMKQLRDVETALANFLASGVLALGHKLGPLLWQLPPRLAYDPGRLSDFFRLLPRSTGAAATLAAKHDEKLKCEAYLDVAEDRPLRHALEVRHPSFAVPEFVELLREHDVALVVADTAGTWPYLEDVTSDLVYVRLHGDIELYASGYTRSALHTWASRISAWHAGESPRTEHTVAGPAEHRRRDVLVYFDNDIKVKAPGDAMTLAGMLGLRTASPDAGPLG
ncbi:uncharacterized protein YecE (DUF72 family) [Prauserella shujinwangii]|uniref:Uncharacterized protein YecE (DUF72 family) n=1 Tax=Prauserella shujinwangii TaxID=1453103 RepID=A0A2T0M121_9PSEU|nr:DUF72 domain-containing protein [Prauserella shujinwangii]PRX50281.1 uncharacterized protein YecE (DUF72 family) [Prauserella shujinwangii]